MIETQIRTGVVDAKVTAPRIDNDVVIASQTGIDGKILGHIPALAVVIIELYEMQEIKRR